MADLKILTFFFLHKSESCASFANSIVFFQQTISLSSLSLNFVQMLQDIAQEANFVVTYVDIEELSVSGKNYMILFPLKIS